MTTICTDSRYSWAFAGVTPFYLEFDYKFGSSTTDVRPTTLRLGLHPHFHLMPEIAVYDNCEQTRFVLDMFAKIKLTETDLYDKAITAITTPDTVIDLGLSFNFGHFVQRYGLSIFYIYNRYDNDGFPPIDPSHLLGVKVFYGMNGQSTGNPADIFGIQLGMQFDADLHGYYGAHLMISLDLDFLNFVELISDWPMM